MARNNIKTLSKLQIGRIRANLSRNASQLGNRLTAHALGEVDMNPSEIKAAQVVLTHVLPGQQQTQIEDITPERGDPLEVQEAFNHMIHDRLVEQLVHAGFDMGKARDIADGRIKEIVNADD